ncbi:MAG: Gfo/Idh/MocA family oxidoreductase [Planctomycetota bacterium]
MASSLNRRQFLRASSAGLTASLLLPRLRAKGANDRLRIGVIGCGHRGTQLLGRLKKNRETANVTVTAVCDVWRVAREKAADLVQRDFDSRPREFSRFADLLALKEVDGVVITTPDFTHSPILTAAARAGKDAYCEKPMAYSLEQANEARQAVRENRAVVQIGTQRRSDGQFLAAAELIQAGVIGKVVHVETGWNDAKPRWEREFADLKEADVDWEAFLSGLPARPFDARRLRCWQLYRDYTCGPVGLLGSHMIDAAIMLVGDSYPVRAIALGGTYVWADREHPDMLECVLEYPSGFLLRYSTRLANSRESPEATVYGTKGTFDTDSWEARPEGGGEGRLDKPIPVAPRESLGHVRNWLDCMRSREDPAATVEMGHAHSVASIMAHEAYLSGRRHRYEPASSRILAE